MALPNLSGFELIYLASPYSRFPAGLHAAFVEASRLAGNMLKAGVRVYAPISHSHPLATYGRVDPLDHSIWLPFNEAIMDRCDCLAVAKMEGWQDSKGIAFEVEYFTNAGKPVFYLEPADIAPFEHISQPVHRVVESLRSRMPNGRAQ